MEESSLFLPMSIINNIYNYNRCYKAPKIQIIYEIFIALFATTGSYKVLLLIIVVKRFCTSEDHYFDGCVVQILDVLNAFCETWILLVVHQCICGCFPMVPHCFLIRVSWGEERWCSGFCFYFHNLVCKLFPKNGFYINFSKYVSGRFLRYLSRLGIMNFITSILNFQFRNRFSIIKISSKFKVPKCK